MNLTNNLNLNIKIKYKHLNKHYSSNNNNYLISFSYNNNKIYYIYHGTKPDDIDFDQLFYLLLFYSNNYDYCYNYSDYCNENGYDTNNYSLSMYKKCKKYNIKIHKMFNENEINSLTNFFYNS